MKIRFMIGLALCLLQGVVANAQILDTRYKAPLITSRVDYYEDVAELPDRKLIVALGDGGGSYYFGNKQLTSNLVRLTPSGALDNLFKPDWGGYAERVFSYKSGSVFIVDSWSDDMLWLLSRTGQVMKAFEIYGVKSVCVLPDYSFLVSTGDGLVKYKANLQVDTSFGVEGWLGVEGTVYDIKYFGGKLYVAGSFWAVGDAEINDIARLNTNGSVDDSFDPGDGSSESIGSITIQPDGKILLGNTYNEWFDDEYFGGSLVRLNTDGSIDWDFETWGFGSVGNVSYTNGKILVAAQNSWQGVHRLNLDGSHDESFEPISIGTWDGGLNAFVTKTNDFIVTNTYSEEEFEYGLRKYNSKGQRVASFKPALSSEGYIYMFKPMGKKILISGDFHWVNGVYKEGMARLSNSGALDNTFSPALGGFNSNSLVTFSDGSLVGYTYWWGTIVRLNPDGSLDEEYDFEEGPFHPSWITEAHALPNGGIAFKAYYNYSTGMMGFGARAADGNYIDGFPDMLTDVYYGSYGTEAHDIAVQPDGKIIYGRVSTTINGSGGYEKITRFNPDGTVDNTFSVGSAHNQYFPSNIIVLNDGGIFLDGNFNQFNGYNVNKAVKLSSTGSVDENFLDNYAAGNYYSENYNYGPAIRFRNGIMKWGYSYNEGYWRLLMINHDGTSAGIFSVPNLWVDSNPGLAAADDRTLYLFGSYLYVKNVRKPSVRVLFPSVKPLPVQVVSNDLARIAQNVTYNVFPNPTSDYITFDTDAPAKVNIVTMDGNVKVDANVKNSEDQIDVRNLQPGRYVIKMEVNGKTRTTHFIKK